MKKCMSVLSLLFIIAVIGVILWSEKVPRESILVWRVNTIRREIMLYTISNNIPPKNLFALNISPSELKDIWGNQFIYLVNSTKWEASIISYGPSDTIKGYATSNLCWVVNLRNENGKWQTPTSPAPDQPWIIKANLK